MYVLGSVRQPGAQQLQSGKSLAEAISQAGGLADDAGYAVKVVRRLEWGRIPLPSAKDDESGQYSVVEVSLKQILDGKNFTEDIALCPQDVLSVPRGQMVYVVGQVPRPGGFVLGDKSLSVLQAFSLVGGADKSAALKKARILRTPPGGGNRTEIPVDINRILQSKTGDVPLQPDDILFVPASTAKKALTRSLDVLVNMAGLLIIRLP